MAGPVATWHRLGTGTTCDVTMLAKASLALRLTWRHSASVWSASCYLASRRLFRVGVVPSGAPAIGVAWLSVAVLVSWRGSVCLCVCPRLQCDSLTQVCSSWRHFITFASGDCVRFFRVVTYGVAWRTTIRRLDFRRHDVRCSNAARINALTLSPMFGGVTLCGTTIGALT